jgi:hypothetical protein
MWNTNFALEQKDAFDGKKTTLFFIVADRGQLDLALHYKDEEEQDQLLKQKEEENKARRRSRGPYRKAKISSLPKRK